MFKKRTVLIVGAGASFEARMPVGTTLAGKIADAAKVIGIGAGISNQRLSALRYSIMEHTAEGDRQGVIAAARKIANGIHLAGSIDAFIDRHVGDNHVARLGKALIASEILDAESRSKLVPKDEGLDLSDLMDTWYHSFGSLLTTGYQVGQLEDFAASVTIICFNYDRCIEQYLTHAISRGFSLSYGAAYQVMSKVRIIHPYGDIGRLPKSPRGSYDGEYVAFGEELDWSFIDPFEFSSRIRTFTEQEHDTARQAQIFDALKDAERLIFLGFSFQPQNMELMSMPAAMRNNAGVKEVLSTGVGINVSEITPVQSAIIKLYKERGLEEQGRRFVHIDMGATCADLFQRNRLAFLYD